jgi:hypothetical protein
MNPQVLRPPNAFHATPERYLGGRITLASNLGTGKRFELSFLKKRVQAHRLN